MRLDPLPRAGDNGTGAAANAPPPPPAFGTVLPAAERPRAKPKRRLGGVVVGIGVGLALAAGGYFGWRSMKTEPGASVAAAGVATAVEATPSGEAHAAVAVAKCDEGMAYIEPGVFFAGTDADKGALKTARPAHKVEVSEAYCLDLTEVTVDAYRACSRTGECKRAYRDSFWPQGGADDDAWEHGKKVHGALCNEAHQDRDAHPVNCVTWRQAQAYCEWRGGSLPTEVQWEFAARGSDGRVYSWGDTPPNSELMNGCGAECAAWRAEVGLPATPTLYEADDGYPGTAPVGSHPAAKTQHGLVDMAGNVFEWTSDVFHPYGEVEKLAQPVDTGRRVIRGGAFNSFDPSFADPALRFPQTEDTHSHGIGFRCAAKAKG